MKDDDIIDEIKKTRQDIDILMSEMIGYSKISMFKHNYYNPPVDIYQTKKEYIIVVELPGMSKDEITISVSDDILYVKGVRRVREKDNKVSYYHMEISYGPFERRIRIPRNIDYESMNVTLDNGLLKIILPLKAKIMKRIEIE